MQAMRKLFSYGAIAFLLFAAFTAFNHSNSGFTGISNAQALPAELEPINLDEIKSFLSAKEPRILFLYASWCPYCKKQMAGFAYFLDKYPTDNIIAVSTDQHPEKLAAYLKEGKTMPFTPYIYTGDDSLMKYIKEAGGSFGGGIPYFAVFENGKFKQEFMGLTHPKILAEASQK